MIGRQLGHYRVVARIGAGAMGVVYRAHDERLDRDVAIKVLAAGLFDNAAARQRFRKEALSLSRAAHPGIATVHDFDTQDGIDFLVMEYIPGRALSEVLDEGRLPADQVLALGRQMSEALEAAHANGIIHRDLKPGNIRVTPEGRAKILDFGIARQLAAPDATTRTATAPAVVGTLPYMAPEQLRGAPGDVRSDVYAVGAILYEMCTGRRPFPQRQQTQLVEAILHDTPAAPHTVADNVPAVLERTIAKAMRKDPSRRQQSARELCSDLTGATTGTFPLERPRRFIRTMIASAALVTAVVLLGVLAVPRLFRGEEPRPAPPHSAQTTTRLKLGILPVRDLSGRLAPAEWAGIVSALFTSELTGLQDVGVVDPLSLEARLRSAIGPDPSGQPVTDVLRAEAIGLAVEPTLLATGAGFEVRANLLDAANGEIVLSRRASLSDAGGLPGAVAELAKDVVGYLQLQKRATGDADLRPWVSLRTTNIEAVKEFTQANRYIFKFQLTDVQRHLDRAIELDPDFVAPRLWAISGLMMRGRTTEAEEHYRHLQTLESRASPFEQAMIDYAGALIRNDPAAEARYLEVALQYSPDNNILLLNLAAAETATGDWTGARAHLDPLVKARWEYPPLYSLFGACAILSGHPDGTRRELERSLSLAGVDPNVHGVLEALALADGDDAAADRHRRACIAQYTESGVPSAIIRIYEALGQRAFDAGNLGAARALSSRLLQLAPGNARALDVLRQAGDLSHKASTRSQTKGR